nr:hypothetical protein [Tanacetum cinerariifolium]
MLDQKRKKELRFAAISKFATIPRLPQSTTASRDDPYGTTVVSKRQRFESNPVFQFVFHQRKKIDSEIGIITRGESKKGKRKRKENLLAALQHQRVEEVLIRVMRIGAKERNKVVKVSKSKERTTTVKVQEKDCKNLKGIEKNSQAANEEDQNEENDQRDDNERSASNTEDERLQI